MSDLVWTKEWPQEPGWYWIKYSSNTSIFFITPKSIAAVDPESGRLVSSTKENFLENQLLMHGYFDDELDIWIQLSRESLRLSFFGPLEEPK